MRAVVGEAGSWAQKLFGRARVGDSRRTARLVSMAARAAERPAGRVSAVFKRDKERQGAYDLLECRKVDPAALLRGLGESAAQHAAEKAFVFVPVDGSSTTLADHAASKDFGSLGALRNGTRGLKVISALGVSPEGVPLEIFTQVWWARTNAKIHNAKAKRRRNRRRKVDEKETRFWLQAVDETAKCAESTGAKLWFQLDREGDNRDILLKLAATGHQFTVRGAWDRLIEATGDDKQYLRQWLNRQRARGSYSLKVSAGPNRTERTAHMVMRWARVVLRLRNKRSKAERKLGLNVVWVREEGTCPSGEKPIDWLLLTNAPVTTTQEAQQVVFGYAQRWRIEDFHKTWKSGACDVEKCQLRTKHAVQVWATILAAVAARIERLKHLARTEPETPASVELTPHEIKALIILKRENKKRTETISDAMPTIGQATLWIAELGGYTGKSSGGPPGSITIRRGLDTLRPAAQVLEAIGGGER
jgi:hypothetical protein